MNRTWSIADARRALVAQASGRAGSDPRACGITIVAADKRTLDCAELRSALLFRSLAAELGALGSYMTLSRPRALVVAIAIGTGVACRATRLHPRVDPEAAEAVRVNAPLNPALAFSEMLPPRTVALLVLDAHSGAPLRDAIVTIQPERRFGVMTDSLGRARLRNVPAGRYAVLVRHLGHHFWTDSLALSDSAAMVVLVQLRRARTMFYDPVPP